MAFRPQPEPSWILFLHPQMRSQEAPSKQSEKRCGRRRASTLQCRERTTEQPQDDQQASDDQQKQEQQHVAAAADWVGGFQRFRGTHSQKPPDLPPFNKSDVFCVFKSSVSAQHKARHAPACHWKDDPSACVQHQQKGEEI